MEQIAAKSEINQREAQLQRMVRLYREYPDKIIITPATKGTRTRLAVCAMLFEPDLLPWMHLKLGLCMPSRADAIQSPRACKCSQCQENKPDCRLTDSQEPICSECGQKGQLSQPEPDAAGVMLVAHYPLPVTRVQGELDDCDLAPCAVLFENRKPLRGFEYCWGTYEPDRHESLAETARLELFEETAGMVLVSRRCMAQLDLSGPQMRWQVTRKGKLRGYRLFSLRVDGVSDRMREANQIREGSSGVTLTLPLTPRLILQVMCDLTTSMRWRGWHSSHSPD